MKPRYTHTHSYAFMYENTAYVLYIGGSVHEFVPAHTLTNSVDLIVHARLSFIESNKNTCNRLS